MKHLDTTNRWRGIRSFERHSLVLSVAGAVYVLIGVSLILSDPTPSRIASLRYALRLLDFSQWGVVFIFAGLLSILSSRWPPISETWGYQALTGLSAGWACFYLTGVVFGDAPTQSLSGFLSWGLIGFMWWAVSGLVNPTHLLKMHNDLRALQTENLELHREILRMNLERKG